MLPGSLSAVSAGPSFSPRRAGPGPLAGGLAALLYPGLLVVAALSVPLVDSAVPGEPVVSRLASLLLLVALPTSWVFTLPFIVVSRLTIVGVSLVSSAALWYLVGRSLARRSAGWWAWTRAYVAVCLAWTSGLLLLVALAAEIAG